MQLRDLELHLLLDEVCHRAAVDDGRHGRYLMLKDSAARPVETCWWVKLPRPSKASAISSNFDETADPILHLSFLNLMLN